MISVGVYYPIIIIVVRLYAQTPSIESRDVIDDITEEDVVYPDRWG